MDSSDTIYGIQLDDKITPKMVRDAIINCFYESHTEVLDNLFKISTFNSNKDEQDTKYHHVEVLIKNLFNDVNGDFNNPTKESLVHVIDKLQEYAKLFRSNEVIKKHYNEIMTLIKKID